MSNTIQSTDLATPKLQKMIGRLTQRQPLMARLGETLAETLREHFLARNQEPNKRGWPKTNFWARIRQATALTSATNDKATVTIADPAFAATLHGGTFTKSHGAYAIPLRPEANGILLKEPTPDKAPSQS
ncbi:MAG: hypothetical protein LBD14_00580 [Puniceicoccales bacterium]|jgi:phage gpG-like protein|nr:hypothetical protein [Puniceicoccales bacterium]